MDIEKRIKTREWEAERRAKELEMRIKARERVAEARRRAYATELREAGLEGEVLSGGRVEEMEPEGTID